jgi:hypothetical protein
MLIDKQGLELIEQLSETTANLYLDYFNNFLTVAKFAEYYGLAENEADAVILMGRRYHEDRVRTMKEAGFLVCNEDFN